MSSEISWLSSTIISTCLPTLCCYAYMQATGMVNDHETGCFRHQECQALAESFSL
ncbi:MAG: DNA-3-methyladenine glycosylase I [Amphritea sp.]